MTTAQDETHVAEDLEVEGVELLTEEEERLFSFLPFATDEEKVRFVQTIKAVCDIERFTISPTGNHLHAVGGALIDKAHEVVFSITDIQNVAVVEIGLPEGAYYEFEINGDGQVIQYASTLDRTDVTRRVFEDRPDEISFRNAATLKTGELVALLGRQVHTPEAALRHTRRFLESYYIQQEV